MRGLQLEKAGSGNDEEHDPADPRRDAQFRVEKFRAAKPEQNHREQIRRGAQHHVGKPGDDCAERADEILRRPVGRRNLAEPDPGWNVLGVEIRARKQGPPRGSERRLHSMYCFLPAGHFLVVGRAVGSISFPEKSGTRTPNIQCRMKREFASRSFVGRLAFLFPSSLPPAMALACARP